MPRIALKTGAYQARSVIANAQRSVNLYAEANPDDAPCPFTYYPTPGLTTLATPTPGRGRGLYRASNGTLYAVVGQTVYSVSPAWVMTALGSLSSGATTPVSMADNQTTLVVVDGSASGYTVNLTTQAFAAISSTAFYGSDRVDFQDTFFVFNRPKSGQFYSSLSNTVTFDPLYFATKIGASDKLAGVASVHRELWLLGERTSEIWVNSGASSFPFAIMDGAFIHHGCASVYSICQLGEALFWLSQDKDGGTVVLKGEGYKAQRVSTHAIETALSSYATVADAVGWTYQQEGHQFYVLTFPTADKSWCFDVATGQWHERVWIDGDGAEHRHRGIAAAFSYGVNVCQDWETGKLYQLSLDVYTDDGSPIVRRRGFPHMGSEGNRVYYSQFLADLAVGRAPLSITQPPQIFLRYSDTRGETWGNPIAEDLGATGDYYHSVQFNRLGYARDRVFELFWSAALKTALNGAFIDAKVGKS